MNLVGEAYGYTRVTSSTTVYPSNCITIGIFVTQASASPSIQVMDGDIILLNNFVPQPASFYPIPAVITKSLIINISGTVDCTVFWST